VYVLPCDYRTSTPLCSTLCPENGVRRKLLLQITRRDSCLSDGGLKRWCWKGLMSYLMVTKRMHHQKRPKVLGTVGPSTQTACTSIACIQPYLSPSLLVPVLRGLGHKMKGSYIKSLHCNRLVPMITCWHGAWTSTSSAQCCWHVC
jgi:hypothetical protein